MRCSQSCSTMHHDAKYEAILSLRSHPGMSQKPYLLGMQVYSADLYSADLDPDCSLEPVQLSQCVLRKAWHCSLLAAASFTCMHVYMVMCPDDLRDKSITHQEGSLPCKHDLNPSPHAVVPPVLEGAYSPATGCSGLQAHLDYAVIHSLSSYAIIHSLCSYAVIHSLSSRTSSGSAPMT